MNATTTEPVSERLREAMVTKIEDAGYQLSGTVGEALHAVPRHAFVPHAALEDAYASDIVVTKRRSEWGL